MARRELILHLVVGKPRLNIWCDHCLTSAGYEIDVYRLADDGPHLLSTRTRCRRCTDEAEP